MLVTCVCLVTYPKRAAFLPDVIRSFRGQTLRAKELLIINDGEPLTSNVPDIQILTVTPRTIGEKRSEAAKWARGQYLATWDDDDLSLPTRLEEQVRVLENSGADATLYNSAWVTDADLRLVGLCDRGRRGVIHATCMIRREKALFVGYQPSNLGEELVLLRASRCITVTGEPPYVRREHGGNVSGVYGAQPVTEEVRARVQGAIDAIHLGPGGDDVVGSSL